MIIIRPYFPGFQVRPGATHESDKAGILRKNHPGAERVWFEEAGHPIFEEEPDKFLGVIKNFLGGLPEIRDEDTAAWRADPGLKGARQHDQYGLKYEISAYAAERMKTPFERVENRLLDRLLILPGPGREAAGASSAGWPAVPP